MRRSFQLKQTLLTAAAAFAVVTQAHAGLIVNGGFESGFSGWTRANQLGSEGTFSLQSGTGSPVNATLVPAPPGGVTAAMTDAQGPGSHVLYQTFSATSAVPLGTLLVMDLFIGNRGSAFFTPASLDFSTPTINQQARVDILRNGADPFSVAAADLLLNVFQTHIGDPLVGGYSHVAVDITALLNANLNTPLILRFAEADNLNTFQMGVDNVDTVSPSTAAPEPSSVVLMVGALGVAALVSRRPRVS